MDSSSESFTSLDTRRVRFSPSVSARGKREERTRSRSSRLSYTPVDTPRHRTRTSWATPPSTRRFSTFKIRTTTLFRSRRPHKRSRSPEAGPGASRPLNSTCRRFRATARRTSFASFRNASASPPHTLLPHTALTSTARPSSKEASAGPRCDGTAMPLGRLVGR